MPNKTYRYARKPTTKSVAATKQESSAKAAADETSGRHEVFKANLPMFRATVRGNVVADGESFTAQSGIEYYTFRIAYTRIRNNEKHTMFIKVIGAADKTFPVAKGNYVEVSGDYFDDGVSPGKDGYGPSVFRTLFMGEDATCKVLIG